MRRGNRLRRFPSHLYYLYYFRMREALEDWLRRHRRESGALPSIRELARQCDAAPLTVQRALRRLAAEGVVHALNRKGYFWGLPKHDQPRPPESSDDRFSARFLADLAQGAYHPWKELPARKALAQVYGIEVRAVGRVLSRLADRGALEARGRKLFPAAPVEAKAGASVVVMARCDESGVFFMDTEREIDFFKSVRRELADRNLRMLRVGYFEQAGGRFLDRFGREIRWNRLPGPLLGILLSTWLLQDPAALLLRLEKLKVPISVWWEHSVQDFPRKRFRGGLVGFNLSFGAAAGIAVGKHLASLGRLEVAYLSPFHGNDWSPARLAGLRESLSPWGGRVVAFTDPSVISSWHLERKAGGLDGLNRSLEKTLAGFLEDPRLLSLPTWVAANDHTAHELHRLLRKRGISPPWMMGFDNESISERLGFDSFEFHTEGMVRQMLHHITRPTAEIFLKEPMREMIGRVVARS